MEATQALGNVVQGVAGYEAGKYNRDLSRTMATEEGRAGAAREAEIREAARMAIGEQIAGQGGSGFQMGAGSAVDALAMSQVNAALDALAARRDAAGRARSQIVQGKQAFAAGENALVAGMIGAASSIQNSRTDWAAARSGTRRGG